MSSNVEPAVAPLLRHYRSALIHASVATLLLIAVGVATLLSIDANKGQLDLITQAQAGERVPMAVAEDSDARVQLMAYIFMGAFVVAGIGFFFWIYRASSNLETLAVRGDMPQDFSPASAVYWWFIPFANWVQPFRVMREIWMRSYGSGPVSVLVQAVLVVWWGLWLLCSALGIRAWVSSPSLGGGQEAYIEQLRSQTNFAILNDGLILVNAVIALALIWAITMTQQRKWRRLTEAAVAT